MLRLGSSEKPAGEGRVCGGRLPVGWINGGIYLGLLLRWALDIRIQDAWIKPKPYRRMSIIELKKKKNVDNVSTFELIQTIVYSINLMFKRKHYNVIL